MHRDIGMELEPRTAEQAALDVWRQEFNHERPHESLGMKCPGEIYTRSARKYAGTTRDIAYPEMYSRRVNNMAWLNARLVWTTGTLIETVYAGDGLTFGL